MNIALNGWALALLLSTSNFVYSSTVTLVLAADRQQQIKAWGFTPTPMEWDGKTMLRDPSIARKLYRDSGATMIRLVLGGSSVYDAQARKIGKTVAASYLIPQIQAAADSGIHSYILSLASPPAYMKGYYAVGAYVDGEPNRLRNECEDLLAEYVADLLQQIRQAGVALPAAVSIQAQPDVGAADFGCPPSIGQGAIYSHGQWLRVAVKIRQQLDRREFREIALIGPEALGPAWFEALANEIGARASAENMRLAVSGLAIASTGGNAQTWQTLLRDFRQQPSADTYPVWVLSSREVEATCDRELLVRTFSHLKADLVDLQVSYWFWRFGFSWEPCAESLVWGRAGNETPLFGALRTMWRSAPPGAFLRRIIAAEGDANAVAAFALETSTAVVLVASNITATEQEIAVANLGTGEIHGSIFTDSAQPLTVAFQQRQSSRLARMPGKAVLIAIAPPANRREK